MNGDRPGAGGDRPLGRTPTAPVRLRPFTPAEFAAWYAVCAAILNLDETITRG